MPACLLEALPTFPFLPPTCLPVGDLTNFPPGVWVGLSLVGLGSGSGRQAGLGIFILSEEGRPQCPGLFLFPLTLPSACCRRVWRCPATTCPALCHHLPHKINESRSDLGFYPLFTSSLSFSSFSFLPLHFLHFCLSFPLSLFLPTTHTHTHTLLSPII